MPAETEIRRERVTLSELSSDCLTLIAQIRTSKNVGDIGRLRQKSKDLLERLERDAKDAGIELDDIRTSQFGLAAFFDEAVSTGSFPQKEEWAANPLHLEMFGRADAGEEFFRKLADLRQRPQKNAEVLEVYYLCLVLGYRGKYYFEPGESLRALVEDTKADLLRGREKRAPRTLSPHGMPRENIANAVYKEVPIWIIAAAAGAIGMLYILIMSWLMSNGAAEVVKRVTSFG
jgi:type VI secretion system protein ImpK